MQALKAPLLLIYIESGIVFASVYESGKEHDYIKAKVQASALQNLFSSFKGVYVIALAKDEEWKEVITHLCQSFGKQLLSDLENQLQVNNPNPLKLYELCLLYGALKEYPISDCIVLQFGKDLNFAYLSKNGIYQNGPIFPLENLLEHVLIPDPVDALSEEKNVQLKTGSYYGLLGAIERIVSEMNQASHERSSVKVIATGAFLISLGDESEIREDLLEIIDNVTPHLSLIGLKEIIQEIKKLEN